jgi:L-fucose mutarotase
MLKGIDPRMTADLLDVLMRMGHGDELALVDRNFPAHSTAAETVTGGVIELAGLNATRAAEMICGLMPLDGFVPEGAVWMQHDRQGTTPDPVHEDVVSVIAAAMPEGGGVGSLERQAFYARAREAYAVVRTGEARAYGNFILRKGVIF